MTSSEEVTNMPEHIATAANQACLTLLPTKSRAKYDEAYKLFCDWKSANGVTQVNEDCMLAFLYEKVFSSFPFSV